MMRTDPRDPPKLAEGAPISQIWDNLTSKIIMMVMVVKTKGL